ncbi:MAG: DUF5658 family protein [Terriglobales bacterium]|jgi:hypothetical protein
MKYLLAILLLCVAARAENFAAAAAGPLPDAPDDRRPFWTFENKVDVGVLGGLVAADAITTQRGLSEGFREANPVMRPFVTRGATGQGVGSALGFGVGLGAVYLLHQTHHYKAERVTMRLMVGVEGAVVASNIVQIR